MDYLDEMGIQRWVVREPAEALTPDQAPSDKQFIRPTGANEPVSVQEALQESTPSNLSAATVIQQEDSWGQILADLSEASTCPACASSHPILGEGNQTADWVVVVDAPTRRDIAEQKLLAGRDGQLLDAMLAALALARSEVYLTSIFKCAPTEDYQVTPTCSSLLTRQLSLIKPSKVLVFGEFAAQTVLRSNDPLSVLRAKTHASKSMLTTVGVTASITEILSKPACKGLVWQDLCRLLQAETLTAVGYP